MPNLSMGMVLSEPRPLVTQSVFKLHEKFMSFIEVTSTNYHHTLPCLRNGSLLGIGEDGREEASIRKNSQHMVSHYHFWVHLLHK